MRGTPKEAAGAAKATKKKATAKKKSSEDSGKPSITANKTKESDIPKKVIKKQAGKAKTTIP